VKVKGARVLAGVVFAALASGLACRAAKEARMDEAVFGKTERVYVGRFSLVVPSDSRRYGEEYQVRHLTLTEVGFAEPLDKAFDAAWAVKLAEIAALKA
jgi:hypothetical protein